MGESAIFRDNYGFGDGEDWIWAMEESLTGNVVVLALVGPN